MATRYTIAAGAVDDASKWDGGVAVPVAGDTVQIKHAMTIGTGLTFPAAGGNFLSLNLNSAGGSSPGLTVTGTVTINATTLTGVEKLTDTAATNLTIGPAGNAVTTTSGQGWTCKAAAATPTHILGSLTCGTTSGAHALVVDTSAGLSVDGVATGLCAGSGRGVYVSTGATLTATGGCVGTSATGAAVMVYSGTANLIAPTCTGTCTGAGTGIYCSGIIRGLAGATDPCTCTGTATGAGKGVYAFGTTGTTLTGDCVGAAGAAGTGIELGGSNWCTIKGNMTGTCGAGGIGIHLIYRAVLNGDIILTDDASSSWIRVNESTWKDAAGTGNGRFVRKVGVNTIYAGDGEQFCPTANVAAAGNVLAPNPNYTGGTAGTLTLPGAGYVLTEAWGGPATYGVGGTGSTPTATLTLGNTVYSTASEFGASGNSITPTATTAAAQLTSDRNEVTAKAAYLDNTQTICGIAGTLDMGLYALITGITWPALDEVGGGVNFGPTTGIEYEGTGVNAATLLSTLGLATGNLDTQLAAIVADTNEIQTKLPAGGALMHAAGAAVAKSPATLAAADVSGNVPVDVKLIKTVDADTAITSRVDASTLAAAWADGGRLDLILDGASTLTSQQVRDAMKLAPTSGTPATGSVDKHLDDATVATNFTGVFPTATLVNAPTAATATYSVSTTTVGEAPNVDITQYQYAAFGPIAITAATAQTGDSHSFLVYDPATPGTVAWSLTTAGSEISVGGTGNYTVTLTDTDAHTGTAGSYRYILRNTTDDTTVCIGALTIEAVPNVPAVP